MTTPEHHRPLSNTADHAGDSRLSRRTVVKLGVVGLIGAATGLATTAGITRRRRVAGNFRFFTDEEAALLIAICDQLIPGDDLPGATETGAINYIDRQLTGFLANRQNAYRRGLASFQQTCQAVYHQPFGELTPAVKIDLLRAVETGRVPTALWGDPSPQAFFNLVLAHTMQSFYGSPRHGGNRDYASYRMLRLDYPQVVGQNRYPEK